MTDMTAELLEALQRIMKIHCPLSGDPTHEQLVEFWEYEKTQGRGEADDQLFALAAVAKARNGSDKNLRSFLDAAAVSGITHLPGDFGEKLAAASSRYLLGLADPSTGRVRGAFSDDAVELDSALRAIEFAATSSGPGVAARAKALLRRVAHPSAPGDAQERKPLTDEQIEAGRGETFSIDNPFCPCDSKTMRKAVRWAEKAHGIKRSS